jgi:hypothetical protein
MPGPRDYTRATVMALAHYSGGLCYCPGCPEPVLRVVEDKVHLIVQIAHIRGAFPGSRRYEASMTDDQRRDLPNLLLLCRLCRYRHNRHRSSRLPNDAQAAALSPGSCRGARTPRMCAICAFLRYAPGRISTTTGAMQPGA